jgi:2-polyprenyl-3-methyl-5-hydroxy-6-metoxy-1,4-benzoquinol methylase
MEIDKVKTFWNNRPCNIKHSVNDIGTKKYFDEVEQRRYFVEPHIRTFAEFDKWKGKRVLEIGCGIGTDTINFARYGAFVDAVDISEKSLNIAINRANIFQLDHKINFFLLSAEELTKNPVISKTKYDLIYSFGVLHHTPNPFLAFSEIKKLCCPETVIKIMLYNKFSIRSLEMFFEQVFNSGLGNIKKFASNNSEAQKGCPYTYVYGSREIKKVLSGFGFDCSVSIKHIFPYNIFEYIKHNYVKKWYYRYMPSFVYDFLYNCFGWHLLIDAHVRNDNV